MLQVFFFLTDTCGIIRFKITIYLVIKQNISNLIMKVEFMKTSTPQEKAQCISWFIETKSDNPSTAKL